MDTVLLIQLKRCGKELWDELHSSPLSRYLRPHEYHATVILRDNYEVSAELVRNLGSHHIIINESLVLDLECALKQIRSKLNIKEKSRECLVSVVPNAAGTCIIDAVLKMFPGCF